MELLNWDKRKDNYFRRSGLSVPGVRKYLSTRKQSQEHTTVMECAPRGGRNKYHTRVS